MPDISDAAGISSRLSPTRSLQTARVRLVDEDGSDQLKIARQETDAPGDDIEFSFYCESLIFAQSVWMQLGTDLLTPKGVDVIQGQQAAWPPHIQHGRTFVLGNEHLAVRWSPYGLCIRAQVLLSQKGVYGHV